MGLAGPGRADRMGLRMAGLGYGFGEQDDLCLRIRYPSIHRHVSKGAFNTSTASTMAAPLSDTIPFNL